MTAVDERPLVEKTPAREHQGVRHAACGRCYPTWETSEFVIARCGIKFQPLGIRASKATAGQQPDICPLCMESYCAVHES